ncbi:hypothetical protein N9S69_03795 [Flavobacteriaceae bacterium]|nr:hypothetical protein [Flavobacteriaceae bacterium]
MANEMRTFIKVLSSKKQVSNKLQELFKYRQGNNEVDALDIINYINGTDYSFSDETSKEDWDKEVDFPTTDTWDKLIGSKWLYVEYVHDNLPKNCNIVIRSANSVPIPFLKTLHNILLEIDNKIIIKGTYEDETYDPSGAFIYAGTNYHNMEDLDEIYNQEKALEDDFYNEKWQDKLFKLEQNLVDAFQETKTIMSSNNLLPIVVKINNDNIDKYYLKISNLLIENKINYIKTNKTKYWSSYVFDCEKADITLKSLKKLIKKNISTAEFYEDFFAIEVIKSTSLKVQPSEENAALFNCLQITIPFEKL